MTWFTKLHKMLRDLVVVTLWVVFVIIGAVYVKIENVAVAVVSVIFFFAAITFTIFAVKANKAEKESQSKEVIKKSTTSATTAVASKPQEIASKKHNKTESNNDIGYDEKKFKRDSVILSYSAKIFENLYEHFYKTKKPKFIVKLTGNDNEEMQNNINKISIGNRLDVTFDYEKERFSVEKSFTFNYSKILGFLPAKFNEDFEADNYYFFVSDLYEDGTYQYDDEEYQKTVVEVSIFDTEVDAEEYYTSTIAGVTHENRQEYIKESKVNDKLSIKHEPQDEFPESTSIFNTRTGKQLGFVKAAIAAQLWIQLGENFKLSGKIVEITGGVDEKPYYGCVYELDLSEKTVCIFDAL